MKTKIEKTISVHELIQVLLNVTKPTFVHVILNTEPSYIRKKSDSGEINLHYKKVKKESSWSYLFCCNYGKRLEKEMKKRGLDTTNLVINPNKVGNRVKQNSPLVQKDNGEYHLMLEYFDKVKSKKSDYYNSESNEKIDVKRFMSKSNTTNDELVKVIQPKITSIKRISFGGTVYNII